MTTTVRDVVEDKRSKSLFLTVHVQGDPEDEAVRDLAAEVCELIAGDDAPIVEDWSSADVVPSEAVLLVEGSDVFKDDLFEGFLTTHEVAGYRFTLPVICHHRVIVSEQVPTDGESEFDLRVRVTEDGRKWTRVWYDLVSGEFREDRLTNNEGYL